MKYLILDGYLNGTGIRDGQNGGYIELSELGISSALQKKIKDWVLKYEAEFYNDYSDGAKVEILDNEGIDLVYQIKNELPNSKIDYYSDAKMVKLAT
ncbi:hypothetical protein [Flavobacterium microcysteis]|uniref:Uncharacterized protein n=1 Tax=Flavobacterium microcysteis TaxID=2596891 RepID=A0A501QM34_9FLAO|nr:hypothetical protein [Flavobacterium microcysteis]TPD73663.1 hypothetical protein FJA49_00280 [Flavobacterium microcysteis]